MANQADQLTTLLERINGGEAAAVLPELDQLLKVHGQHPGLLALRAEALRLTGQLAVAIPAFRLAAEQGAGARCWLVAGVLLAAERNTNEALACLHSALALSPDDDEVLDALITTYFNANRYQEGLALARRQLSLSTKPGYLRHAALLVQSNDLYEESSEAFKKIVSLAGDDPAVLGAALVPARFTCEWEWIESLQERIGGCYSEGKFNAPQEYPLTHLTWCADEGLNLGVTRAYVERMVPKVAPCTPDAAPESGRHLRVGYLSCDFRNHATMHLMAGVFESHDRERFEVFAYDYSSPDVSAYRQRFLDAVEHHVPIHTLSDQQAAARIAQDQLDILFDLKLYTGGGRSGILAYRPAALQAAYLGYPGSAASADIDYIVSDRFVTPDSSAPFYTEKFCRLPHSYQCNDRKRLAAASAGSRGAHGLPEDKIVFGAFNQSYKIDRASFKVWLRVLQAVPESVLWLLGQSEAAIANLSQEARLAGIEAERLIFAPFAAPHEHLARLQLADAILDTLVCNGHTTTSDALWAGVPVITARGKHFASRVSESLLNAMDAPELVGADHEDMVQIAVRIGTDSDFRTALRSKLAANRLTAPLFDTARFTRNFETAIEMMASRHRAGAEIDHIDVPDCGELPSTSPDTPVAVASSRLQTAYTACPLCQGSSLTLGFANCTPHELWHEPLPPTIEWMHCSSCAHVHSRHYWTQAGLAEVFRKANPHQLALATANIEAKRATWSPVVERVVKLIGGYGKLFDAQQRALWVDVGCGDGALVMTAADYGFASVGLDSRSEAVSRIQALGFNAMQHDFMTLAFEVTPTVLSMMDVLEHLPYPGQALEKAAQVLPAGGVLVLSMPDLASSAWKAMDAAKSNPYWMEIEHHHNFSRERLIALLHDKGFEVVDFAIPSRYRAQMELYAVRRGDPVQPPHD